MPTLLDEPIKALKGRDPVCVTPGTSLADCLLAIQKTGTGDSVVVADADGRLRGVLTERDIVARLVGTTEDLAQPVESLMNAEPHVLHFDDPIRDAIALMETGRYRNVPDHRRRRRSSTGSSVPRMSCATSPRPSRRRSSTSRPVLTSG